MCRCQLRWPKSPRLSEFCERQWLQSLCSEYELDFTRCVGNSLYAGDLWGVFTDFDISHLERLSPSRLDSRYDKITTPHGPSWEICYRSSTCNFTIPQAESIGH